MADATDMARLNAVLAAEMVTRHMEDSVLVAMEQEQKIAPNVTEMVT